MKVLVIGGTGMVGSQVVKELLGRKVDVQVLTRSPDKAKSLPAGAQAVTGNLQEPQTVRSIFKGIERVFLLNPVSPTETHEGLMAVSGMRTAGVKRVVYLSVQDADKAPFLPHFGSKLSVEAAIKASGMTYTILRPSNFYQNDIWFKDAMLQYGVYPQPLGGTGVSRVDVRDIAEGAAVVLTGDEHQGQTYNLIGPRAMTGQNTAEVWSTVLKKKINYAGDDLDTWEKQQLQYGMPAWMAYDFKMMYGFFQEKGLKASPSDIERQTKLLGHAPRPFEGYAGEMAKMWGVA